MNLPLPRILELTTSRTAPLDANTAGAAADEQVKHPAFLTTQALASFPVAAAAATVVWKVVGGTRLTPAIVCGLIAFWLFLAGWNSESSAAGKFGLFLVGAINGIYLYASVLGIDLSVDLVGIDSSSAK